MSKPFAKKFYASRAWKECRESYIHKVQGLCERCLKRGKVVPGKILHHTNYLTPENINDPQVSLNHEHLEFVCHDCHNDEHMSLGEPVREGLMFDESGDLVREM